MQEPGPPTEVPAHSHETEGQARPALKPAADKLWMPWVHFQEDASRVLQEPGCQGQDVRDKVHALLPTVQGGCIFITEDLWGQLFHVLVEDVGRVADDQVHRTPGQKVCPAPLSEHSRGSDRWRPPPDPQQ